MARPAALCEGPQLDAGGKPSTWLPPGRLVEPSEKTNVGEVHHSNKRTSTLGSSRHAQLEILSAQAPPGSNTIREQECERNGTKRNRMIWIRLNPKKQSGTNRKTKQNGKEPNGSIQNGQTEQTERDGANSLKRTRKNKLK